MASDQADAGQGQRLRIVLRLMSTSWQRVACYGLIALVPTIDDRPPTAMISLCRHFSDALFVKQESAKDSLQYER